MMKCSYCMSEPSFNADEGQKLRNICQYIEDFRNVCEKHRLIIGVPLHSIHGIDVWAVCLVEEGKGGPWRMEEGELAGKSAQFLLEALL